MICSEIFSRVSIKTIINLACSYENDVKKGCHNITIAKVSGCQVVSCILKNPIFYLTSVKKK